MKETWDKMMKASTNTNSCNRAEDLVTYLYGEATLDEAKDFESHMQHCASCRTELATFGVVRQAVTDWRQQALGSLVSPAFEANSAQPHAFTEVAGRKRSAFSALREFFALSPVWMRAATAVAALVFCALAVIAVAHFARKPQTVIVERPVNSGYSDKEVEQMIAQALKKQNAAQAKDAAVASPENVATKRKEQRTINPQIERNASATQQLANNQRRRPLSPRNFDRQSKPEALVSSDYLPFTARRDEEKLPSLADLVDDDNNN